MAEQGTKQHWLTPGAASQLLGVSESTVRRWADAGDIRSYRTSGGHRRVLEDDLRHLVATGASASAPDTDHISDLAIARVRRRLGRGQPHPTLAAFDHLDTRVRDRLRLMGRQLVDLFARYISSDTKGERFAEDARTIGREYGHTLVDSHVGLTMAVSTFNTMRITLEETAARVASDAGLTTEEAVEAIERVLRLADVVLEGMAEVYEGTITR